MADKLVTQVSEEDAKKQKQTQKKEKSCWDKICCGCFSSKEQSDSKAQNSQGGAQPRPAAPPAEKGSGGLLPALTQEQKDRNIHTLVLDLDETLVHSSFQYVSGADLNITINLEGEDYEVFVAKRPGVDQFLKHVKATGWEVIIFTASLSLYADPVLDRLDPDRVCTWRLFREDCTLNYGNFVKDLTRLGRKLEHTLIVDNSPVAYMFQPENAIPITSWFSDKGDNELMNLCPLLDVLVKADNVMAELSQHKPLDLSVPFKAK